MILLKAAGLGLQGEIKKPASELAGRRLNHIN
jgi:hypothetical protein